MDRGEYGWVVDASVLDSVNSARFSRFPMEWLEIVALRQAIIGIAVAGVKATGRQGLSIVTLSPPQADEGSLCRTSEMLRFAQHDI